MARSGDFKNISKGTEHSQSSATMGQVQQRLASKAGFDQFARRQTKRFENRFGQLATNPADTFTNAAGVSAEGANQLAGEDARVVSSQEQLTQSIGQARQRHQEALRQYQMSARQGVHDETLKQRVELAKGEVERIENQWEDTVEQRKSIDRQYGKSSKRLSAQVGAAQYLAEQHAKQYKNERTRLLQRIAQYQ